MSKRSSFFFSPAPPAAQSQNSGDGYKCISQLYGTSHLKKGLFTHSGKLIFRKKNLYLFTNWHLFRPSGIMSVVITWYGHYVAVPVGLSHYDWMVPY